MKLTKADFKDALRDSKQRREMRVRDAAKEREEDGAPTNFTINEMAMDYARVVALRYYIENVFGKQKGTP